MPRASDASSPRLLTIGRARDCTVLTALALLGPYLAHVLPGWDDSPLGARLLPLFYAPLLGVFWRQFGFTLALALVSPWANHILFAMPDRNLAIVLSFEVVVFTLAVAGLMRAGGRRAWVGPVAYLAVKPFSAALIAFTGLLPVPPLRFIANSTTTGWPGMVLLAVLGWLAARRDRDAAV